MPNQSCTLLQFLRDAKYRKLQKNAKMRHQYQKDEDDASIFLEYFFRKHFILKWNVTICVQCYVIFVYEGVIGDIQQRDYLIVVKDISFGISLLNSILFLCELRIKE